MNNQEEEREDHDAEEIVSSAGLAQENWGLSSSVQSTSADGVFGAIDTDATSDSVESPKSLPIKEQKSTNLFFSPTSKGWQPKSNGDSQKGVPKNNQPKHFLGDAKGSLIDTPTRENASIGRPNCSPPIWDFVTVPLPMPTELQRQPCPTGPGAYRMSAIGRIATGYQIDPEEGAEEEIEMANLEQVRALESPDLSVQAWPIADPVVRATPYHDASRLRSSRISRKSRKILIFAIVGIIVAVIISSIAAPAILFNNPEKKKHMQIRSVIMDTFGKEYFDNPQKERALHWIVYEDKRNSLGVQEESHPDSVIQRFSLAAFYFQTSSQQPWVYCNAPVDGQSDTCYYKEYSHRRSEKFGTRWLAAANECHWMGVFCSGDRGSITELHLRNNNLTGTIPADEVSVLSKLASLDLRTNSLTGSISSQIFEESSISKLSLQRNKLTGTIPSLAFSLPSMTMVDLRDNLINGSIPSEIGFFKGTQLLLSDNLLTGPIPEQMYTGNISKVLSLSNNALTGTLSSSVGFLAGLNELILSENPIHGPMPSQIGLLTLWTLALERTNMQGTFPEEIYQNKQFESLRLSGSNFVGTISTRIGQLKDIGDFEVANNKFHGSIPRELSSATKLTSLYLHGNADLTGSIPNGFCSHRLPNGKVTADCTPHAATGVPTVHCPLHCCSMCCDSETEICLEQ